MGGGVTIYIYIHHTLSVWDIGQRSTWKFGSTQLMFVSLTLDSLNASHEQCGPLYTRHKWSYGENKWVSLVFPLFVELWAPTYMYILI